MSLLTLFAFTVIRDQAKLLKESIDIRAVGNRTGRGWSINELQAALTQTRHFALPKQLSCLPIETDYQQLVIVMRRDENLVARQYW